MIRKFLFVGILSLMVSACSKPVAKQNVPDPLVPDTPGESLPHVVKEFDGGTGFYTYAPSPVDYENSRYVFVCRNETPYVVRDHIYLYKGTDVDGVYTWATGKQILAPSLTGWDEIHVCDPDVRKFEFKYQGKQYHWILFYLGTDQTDNNHNQIGVAFSEFIDGPYIKYANNPLVTSNNTEWGVGQSSTIILDSLSMLLCYSKGTASHTGMFVRQLTVNKSTETLLAGPENEISFNGLTNLDGSYTTLVHNASIAFSHDYIYMAAPMHPFEQFPAGIAPVSSSIQLAQKSIGDGLFSNKWKILEKVGKSASGFPRNHNAGILTDEFGFVNDESSLTIFFTASTTDGNWLWSYGLFSTIYKP